MSKKILVVDDEESIRDFLGTMLQFQGYEVMTSSDGVSALEILDIFKADVVLTDLKMPKMDGLTLLSRINALNTGIVTIIMTGFGSIESAVEAMQKGAFYYLTKPFHKNEILILIEKAFNHRRLIVENQTMQLQLRNKYKFENLIGDSGKMLKVFEMIEKVADSDSTVLILGESGTGKELVTRALHYNSSRRNKLLVPVNCGAIPEELLESELFGHTKGAFTGATTSRVGRFELADGGTIFLDEIGEMSPKLQVKLLRFLQERSFEPVGSTKSIKVSVRLIAATNADLEKAIKQKKFREDLYYRLNVIPIHLPSLRERRSDIPLLISHFIEKYNKEKNKDLKGITPEALKILTNYHFSGNVRELENLIERITILKGTGYIELSDFPEKFMSSSDSLKLTSFNDLPEEGVDLSKIINDIENSLIIKALEKTKGNKQKAALLLNIKRTTLIEKIKRKELNKNIPVSESHV